jgi:hypothetical protein
MKPVFFPIGQISNSKHVLLLLQQWKLPPNCDVVPSRILLLGAVGRHYVCSCFFKHFRVGIN